jgi:hypothetical protein
MIDALTKLIRYRYALSWMRYSNYIPCHVGNRGAIAGNIQDPDVPRRSLAQPVPII